MTWLLFLLTMVGPGTVEVEVIERYSTPEECRAVAEVASVLPGVFAYCERSKDA